MSQSEFNSRLVGRYAVDVQASLPPHQESDNRARQQELEAKLEAL